MRTGEKKLTRMRLDLVGLGEPVTCRRLGMPRC